METKQEATMLSASKDSVHSDLGNSMPNLPDEIWYKVFSYLLLNDRKNIRLTSRRFYDVTNCLIVQKTEEIVFNGSINTDAALLSFSNSKRKVWNIKLNQTYLFDYSVLPFFENQGAKVHSLIFDDCRIARGLLKNIIEYCENLHHFALFFRSKKYFSNNVLHKSFISWDELELIFSDFTALKNSGIIRHNVTNFILNLGEDIAHLCTLTNEKFLNFFIVFPSIKKLHLVFPESFEFSLSSTNEINNKISSFCFYYQLVKMFHQLEELNLSCKCVYYYYYKICPLQLLNEIPSAQIEKCKEVSMNCTCLEDVSAVNILPQFRYLTDFKCSLPFSVRLTISESAFLELILNTATKLCNLSVFFPWPIPQVNQFNIDRSCCQALLRSQLRTLYINTMAHQGVNFPTLLLEDCPLPNYVLKYFYFDTTRLFLNNSVSWFTTYFHSLELLIVEKFSVNILQNIFKYQTNLRCLELYNCRLRPDVRSHQYVPLTSLQQWLSNTDLLNRHLDHLTHLLLAEDESLDLSEFLLREFVFPKLQSLVIILSNQAKIFTISDSLWQSIQNSSELEYLEIKGRIEMSFTRWFTLCSSLTKLHYFLIINRDFQQFDDLEYRRLFQVCPSLRITFHGHDSVNYLSVKYFKDITTNMVRNIPCPRDIIYTRKFIYEGIPQKYYKHCYNVSTIRDCHITSYCLF